MTILHELANPYRKKAIIHVNRAFIAANAKDKGTRPVYTMKFDGQTIYAREITFDGHAHFVYNGDQLSCGARAWVETNASCFNILDRMTFAQAKTQYPDMEEV